MSTQSEILTLEFSFNWNNKLNCNYFTTLRISAKWMHHTVVVLKCKKQFKVVKLLDAKKLYTSQLNDWICYLDTGYNKIDTLNILGKMYKFDPAKDNKIIYLYLYESLSSWMSEDEAFQLGVLKSRDFE